MKAKKHIEFDRVFAYITDEKTDILWFENYDVMRRAGQSLIDLARIGGNEVEIKDEGK